MSLGFGSGSSRPLVLTGMTGLAALLLLVVACSQRPPTDSDLSKLKKSTDEEKRDVVVQAAPDEASPVLRSHSQRSSSRGLVCSPTPARRACQSPVSTVPASREATSEEPILHPDRAWSLLILFALVVQLGFILPVLLLHQMLVRCGGRRRSSPRAGRSVVSRIAGELANRSELADTGGFVILRHVAEDDELPYEWVVRAAHQLANGSDDLSVETVCDEPVLKRKRF